MQHKPYGQLVAQAEAAVASVKDAELRRVAFEKVLNDLLTDGGASSGIEKSTSQHSRTEREARGSKTGARKSAKKPNTGPQAYVEELLDDGFFKKQKTISAVKSELENRGHHVPLTSLSGPLQKLCQRKRLRRQKLDGEGKKKAYSYSNW
jgi:hypothetical protein